jgi:hypothetical protein
MLCKILCDYIKAYHNTDYLTIYIYVYLIALSQVCVRKKGRKKRDPKFKDQFIYIIFSATICHPLDFSKHDVALNINQSKNDVKCCYDNDYLISQHFIPDISNIIYISMIFILCLPINVSILVFQSEFSLCIFHFLT